MKAQNVLIAHPENEEQINTLKVVMNAMKIKFEISKKEEYNPEFVAKIQRSRKQYEEGKFISLDKNDLKKYMGIE